MAIFIIIVVVYISVQIFFEAFLIKFRPFMTKSLGEYSDKDANFFSWGWIVFLPLCIFLLIFKNFYLKFKRYLLKESEK